MVRALTVVVVRKMPLYDPGTQRNRRDHRRRALGVIRQSKHGIRVLFFIALQNVEVQVVVIAFFSSVICIALEQDNLLIYCFYLIHDPFNIAHIAGTRGDQNRLPEFGHAHNGSRPRHQTRTCLISRDIGVQHIDRFVIVWR